MLTLVEHVNPQGTWAPALGPVELLTKNTAELTGPIETEDLRNLRSSLLVLGAFHTKNSKK